MIFARKAIGATDLKLGMQLHLGSYMGWVSPGHTSSFPCVMTNIAFQKKHLNLGS